MRVILYSHGQMIDKRKKYTYIIVYFNMFVSTSLMASIIVNIER